MTTLASIDPADLAVGVEQGAPITVRLQRSGSVNTSIVETAQADFATGTLSGMSASPLDRLELLSTALEDFEAYTAGTVPTGWTQVIGSGGCTVETISAQKSFRSLGTGNRAMRWGVDALVNRDAYLDIYFTSDCDCRVHLRTSGTFYGGVSGSYFIQLHSGTSLMHLFRMQNGSNYLLASSGITFSASTWYTLRFQVSGSTIRAKFWAKSGSEPGSWMVSATDGDVTAAGDIVLQDVANGTTWYDNITLMGEGTTYGASGSYVSVVHSLTAVGTAGSAVIEYDADVPDGTTLTVKTRFNGGGWSSACDSGDPIASIADGDDLTGDTVEVQVEMTTSDDALTPTVTEIRLVFRPQDPDQVEVLVDGVSFTVANGGLVYWNESRIVGGVLTTDETDLYYQTQLPWWAADGAEVTVEVVSAGSTISTTTFTVEPLAPACGGTDAYWVAWESSPEWKYAAGECCFNVFDLAVELVTADGWYAVSEPLTRGGDAYYWVAHAVAFDGPGGGIVGLPAVSDTGAAGSGRCWFRGDLAAAGIVQGWIRGDAPAGGVVAVELVADGPAGGIVAHELAADGLGAGAVYRVDHGTVLEVQVIDAETAAALAAAGVVMP